jgi:hypothetical protein
MRPVVLHMHLQQAHSDESGNQHTFFMMQRSRFDLTPALHAQQQQVSAQHTLTSARTFFMM